MVVASFDSLASLVGPSAALQACAFGMGLPISAKGREALLVSLGAPAGFDRQLPATLPDVGPIVRDQEARARVLLLCNAGMSPRGIARFERRSLVTVDNQLSQLETDGLLAVGAGFFLKTTKGLK